MIKKRRRYDANPPFSKSEPRQVTNYFMQRYNSGFVEGFNNKVKVLKRRCYGLSNAIKLFQRLIIDTMGLKRFAFGVTAFLN